MMWTSSFPRPAVPVDWRCPETADPAPTPPPLAATREGAAGAGPARRTGLVSDSTHILSWLAEWLEGDGSLLILTDYDGTLVPIVAEPDDAHLPPEVHEDLQVLARSPRVRLGVISGRDLRDVRRRVAVAEAIYAGCHGLEIEGPDLAFTHPDAVAERDKIQVIAEILSERAAYIPGMRVEPKRLTVAVHYRQVADAEVRRVEMELARALRVEGTRLKILHGSKVIEVLPQVDWTKGECALWIRDAVLRGGRGSFLAVYMGDDWTDEHVFERLVGQALTIKVGSAGPATRASYRLADVAEVHHLLSALAARVAQRSVA
jgi:trehalose-phosphatase